VPVSIDTTFPNVVWTALSHRQLRCVGVAISDCPKERSGLCMSWKRTTARQSQNIYDVTKAKEERAGPISA
jgi:hypothetical protein